MSGNVNTTPTCSTSAVLPELKVLSYISNVVTLIDLTYNSYIKTSNPPLTFQYNIAAQNNASANVYYTVALDKTGISGNTQNSIIVVYNLLPATKYQFTGRTKYLGCNNSKYSAWGTPVYITTQSQTDGVNSLSASITSTISPAMAINTQQFTTPISDYLNSNGSTITVTSGPISNNGVNSSQNQGAVNYSSTVSTHVPFSYLSEINGTDDWGDVIINDNDFVKLNNSIEQKLFSDIQSYEPSLVDKIVNKLQNAINSSGMYLQSDSPSYESFAKMGTDYFAAQDSTELTMQQGRFNYVPPKLPFQYNTTF